MPQPPASPIVLDHRSAPLVGRAAELASLRDAAERAARSEGGVVLVHGEAGVGKSRLCRELAAGLDDVLVLRGQTYPGDDTVAHAVVVDTLRAIRRDQGSPVWQAVRHRASRMAPILPELVEDGTRPAAEDERQLFETVLDVVHDAAAGRPVLWIAEDVQWADPLSWSFLAYCARRAAGVRLLLVVTFRDDEAVPEHPAWTRLAVFGERDHVTRIGLQRLGPADAAELARRVAGDGAQAVCEIVERSGGTPLLIEELAAMRRAVGPGEGSVPAVVRATARERARLAGAHTRGLLEAAAVMGRDTDLEAILELHPEDARAVDALVHAGLLHPSARSGGLVEFRHPLLREAVYEGIPLERRRCLHAEAAAILARSPAPQSVERVARHWELAGRPEDALAALLEVMGAARQHGLLRRVTTLGLLALDLVDRHSRLAGRRRELVHALIDDLRLDGRLSDVLPLAREAWRDADSLPPRRRANVAAVLAEAECYIGRDLARANQLLASELARAADLHTAETGLLAVQGALCAAISGDLELARRLADRAVADAAADGSLEVELAARMTVVNVKAFFHEPREALVAAAREAAARARAAGLTHRQATVTLSVARYTVEADDCREVIALGREGGAHAATWARAMLGCITAFEGRAAEATAIFDELEQDTDERNHAMHPATVGRALAALMRGDLDAARDASRRLDSDWDFPSCRTDGEAVHGWLAWEAGDLAGATTAFAESLATMEPSGIEPGWNGPWFVMLHVDALLRSGDRERAEADLAAAAGLLDGPDGTRMTSAAFAAARLRLDPSAASLAAAEAATATARWPWLAGLVQYWAAELLHDPAALSRAHAVWEGIGYTTGVERAAALPALLAAAPDHPCNSRLTRREQHVASLIATGLTNAQIAEQLCISPLTVAHHVSSILGKLDLSSRTQVAVHVATAAREHAGR